MTYTGGLILLDVENCEIPFSENSLQEIDIEDSESPEISNDPKKESPMNNLADQISQDDEEDPKNLRLVQISSIATFV